MAKLGKDEIAKIPDPTGWRIVILPHKGVEKTKGGVLLSDQAIQEQQSEIEQLKKQIQELKELIQNK